MRGHGARQTREPSTFPIIVPKGNQCIFQYLPRTNNAVEGFHSARKRSKGRAHEGKEVGNKSVP